ncbi:Holliday junction branch migration protein RuvA [Alteromonadaceae bacterium BrNp21-10]|nr:Holliday junction branch migration protein RuvA [Alteromonadaceae bacterium BrNp21-10]
MIGRIRGILVEKQAPEVLVEANGVGYEIQVPMTSFYQLPEVGSEAIIYTHFVVREDAQLLFGFINKTERSLFRELIKANGVGPKLALTIMSGMSTEQFVHCVNCDDVTSLVKLPGVGKKTAERLLIEMRDRLKNIFTGDSAGTGNATQNTVVTASFISTPNSKDEALSALVALGYKPALAQKVINSVYVKDMQSEQLIRESLRAMV